MLRDLTQKEWRELCPISMSLCLILAGAQAGQITSFSNSNCACLSGFCQLASPQVLTIELNVEMRSKCF